MMTTRGQVLRLAERLNADVLFNSVWGKLDVEVVAPEGHHWACDGVHALVGHQNDGESRAVVWTDLLDRMTGGLEKCDPNNRQCRDWSGD